MSIEKKWDTITTEGIRSLAENFLKEADDPLHRYKSYEYCFNYFQEHKKKKDLNSRDNREHSCLQLGFYLASWGMYRGSAALLQKSVKVYEKVIEEIVKTENEDLWEIDVDDYDEKTVKRLIGFKNKIGRVLLDQELNPEDKQQKIDTLASKIMMGVYGNTPAFDTNVNTFFRSGGMNETSLNKIHEFYTNHEELICDLAKKTKSLKYSGGDGYNYTKAKIIDLIAWEGGK